MQKVADYLNPSVYPKAAIEAVQKIEEEATRPKSNVCGFKIKFDSDNKRIAIEKTTRTLVWKGTAL